MWKWGNCQRCLNQREISKDRCFFVLVLTVHTSKFFLGVAHVKQRIPEYFHFTGNMRRWWLALVSSTVFED